MIRNYNLTSIFFTIKYANDYQSYSGKFSYAQTSVNPQRYSRIPNYRKYYIWRISHYKQTDMYYFLEITNLNNATFQLSVIAELSRQLVALTILACCYITAAFVYSVIIDMEISTLLNLGERRVIQAYCGSYHTCLLLDDGSVRLFGDYRYNECNTTYLGERRVIQAACGHEYTCLVLDDGSVRIFGNNSFGKIFAPDLEEHRVIRQPVVELTHACFYTTAVCVSSVIVYLAKYSHLISKSTVSSGSLWWSSHMLVVRRRQCVSLRLHLRWPMRRTYSRWSQSDPSIMRLSSHWISSRG
eukprot:Mrub_07420.p1 GENE.Mrub_07420~~Mrub_07420.p1  ORF type:complete len:299 (+),score=-35.66 Mrub_07420:11-907(+)